MAGRGTITERGEDTFLLRYSDGFDSKGKRITYSKTVKCGKRDAEKELAAFITSIEGGNYSQEGNTKLGMFIERWLKDYGEKQLQPKTLQRYKQLSTRVIYSLGHMPLQDIKPIHVIRFYDELRKPDIRTDHRSGALSDTTVRHHHTFLHKVLSDAVRWGLLQQNPVDRVDAPKISKAEIKCYDQDQAAALLKALEAEPLKHRTILFLVLLSGLRRGEVFGLFWPDVDFANNTITVRRSCQYLPGTGIFFKETKTSRIRKMSIPQDIMNMLKVYKVEQAENRLKAGELWGGSEQVFATDFGNLQSPDFLTKWMNRFVARTGLDYISVHGLRHTSATLALNAGVSIPVVSGRLGHATSSTTLNVYSHFLQSADKVAADTLMNVLKNNA